MSAAPLRLKVRADFLRVAAKGRKAPVHGLVLQALPRDDQMPARIGFTVTKKVGNAVVRNRTRRRLKEAARLVLADLPLTGIDLVLIGRDSTRKRDFADLSKPSFDPTKFGKPGLDHAIIAAHFCRHRHRRQRILDIVPPRHRQLDPGNCPGAPIAPTQHHIEAIAPGDRRDMLAANIGLR